MSKMLNMPKKKFTYHVDDLDPKEEEKDQISHSDDSYGTEEEKDAYDTEELRDYEEEDYKDNKGSIIEDIEKLTKKKR